MTDKTEHADKKPAYISTKSPLEGVLSQEAQNAIGRIGSSLVGEIRKDGLTRKEVQRGVDKVALIIAAELDVADGAADKVIHKETLERKFQKILKNPDLKMMLKGESATEAMQHFKTVFKNLPDEVSQDRVAGVIAESFKTLQDKVFQARDINKDQTIDASDFSLFEKIGASMKSSAIAEGTHIAAPSAKPQKMKQGISH